MTEKDSRRLLPGHRRETEPKGWGEWALRSPRLCGYLIALPYNSLGAEVLAAMKRLPLLFITAVICLWSAVVPTPAADRPNILVILADDLGFSDLGCYGGEIHTPCWTGWPTTACVSLSSTIRPAAGPHAPHC